MAEKKAPIPLAEQHRAAHAARNIVEKYFDRQIDNAKLDAKFDRAKGLEVSKDGCLNAMDALVKMLDVLEEFPDDFRLFYRDLLERQRLKIKDEEAKIADIAAKGGRAIHALRTGSA